MVELTLTDIANNYNNEKQKLKFQHYLPTSDHVNITVYSLKLRILNGEMDKLAHRGLRSCYFWNNPYDDDNFKFYSDVAMTYGEYKGTKISLVKDNGILCVSFVW